MKIADEDLAKVAAIFVSPNEADQKIQPTLVNDLRQALDRPQVPGAVKIVVAGLLDELTETADRFGNHGFYLSASGIEAFQAYMERDTEPALHAQLVTLVAAAVFVEARDEHLTLANALRETALNPFYFSYLASEYSSWKTWHSGRPAELRGRLDAFQNKVAESVRKQVELEKSFGEMETAKDDLANRITSFDQEVATTKSNLETFRATVQLEERLRLSTDHWEGRARWSAIAFSCSLVMLLAIFLGAPSLAFIFQADVQAFFADFATAAYRELCPTLAPGEKCEPHAGQLAIVSLNRLVAIALPLLLFFWLIKLLVRYNLHALVMGNDARQRSTMIKTFLYLADKDVVKKEDKTELLSAIFRPPPGTTGDSIEIPDVIEVVKKIKG
ncbi:MAG: hypothetical protein KL863_09055 [Rhizobium sp.]|nr:hypothetical protein [Rhizobium sp.]